MSEVKKLPEPLIAFENFEDAARQSLRFLHERLGFNLWMITRTEEEDWIVLESEDRGYGVKRGDVFQWSDSFCSRMVRGEGPSIAPDASQVPAYASAPIARQVAIGAYIGIPLTRPDGSLFGTLCAIDPEPQPSLIREQWPLVQIMARLLSSLLDAELRVARIDRQLERVKDESLKDAMTGLYNRRAWGRFLAAEEQRCQRYGSPAAVAIIDLDDLKTVNDRDGHAAGDQLIQRAARCLVQATRASDVVARIGGDEFAVLMVEIPPAQAQAQIHRITSALTEARVAASVGWAARDPREGLDAAIRLADERMYQAKQAGRTK